MDPVAEIIAAREEARQCQDPHVDVCFLATATAEGRPEVRAISLRDIDAKGFGLLLNVTSPKWQQLAAGGQCSLHMLWSTVRRQYRVYGRLEPMAPERLQQYWDRVLYTYAAIQAWAQAAQKTGSTNFDKMVKTLKSGKFNTVLGSIGFDGKGDVTAPGYVFYEWSKGTYDYVK